MISMNATEALQLLNEIAQKRDNYISDVSDNVSDYMPELDEDFFEFVPYDDSVTLAKASQQQLHALFAELQYEYVNAVKYNAQYDLVRLNDSSFDVCFFPPVEPAERIKLKRDVCSEIIKHYRFFDDSCFHEEAVLKRKTDICNNLFELLNEYADFNRNPVKNAEIAKSVSELRTELYNINSKPFVIQQRNERKIILSHLLQKVCEDVFLRIEREAEMCEHFANDDQYADVVEIVKKALEDDIAYQAQLNKMHQQLDSLRDYICF